MTDFEVFKVKGVLNFPEFITPRSYDNSTNKFIEDLQNGDYGTGLFVDNDSFAVVFEKFEKMIEAFKNSQKYKDFLKKGYSEIVSESNFYKEEDGKIELKFKRASFNKAGNKAKIEIFDSFKNQLPTDLIKEIGNGTEARIIYTVYDWAIEKTDRDKHKYISYGITLCLLGVQILDLKKKSSVMDCITEEEQQEGTFTIEGRVDFAEEEINPAELPF